MERFFSARSVAVVGVSNSPGNLGRAIMHNLMEFRYQGVIYAVGPKGGAFMGHKIHPSVLDIPETVDLAAILVPARVVPEVLGQCARRSIRRVVVQTAGFGELEADRASLEVEIRDILAKHGMRMIGPNCIGIINRANGLAVPFMPFRMESPLGRVAVISQSGGVGGNMINLLAMENLGFSKFASVGNKLDVNENDLADYLRQDPETDVIFCYLEGIADGRRFMEIASRSSKPVVAHKSNLGGAGAVIARSHTASLSSDDRVVDAAFRQAGVFRAREQREALEMIKAFSLSPMRGARLAVISRSGGHAVMAADAADELGFDLPPYPREFTELVLAESRAKVIAPHNPLDLGDLFNLPLYLTLASRALEREDIDGLLFIHNYQGVLDAEDSRRLVRGLGDIIQESPKPVAVCVFTMQSELEINRKAVSFPIFTDPREALRSLAWNREFHDRRVIPLGTVRPTGIDPERAGACLEACADGPVPSKDLAGVLMAYGIPLVPHDHATDTSGLVQAAAGLGFPLVMKTAQPEVIHKTDAGGVVMGIKDEGALGEAYRKLLPLGQAVILQRMADPGLEWFAGGRQDASFGSVVVTGPGGIHVELLGETAIRVGPLAEAEADSMLSQLRGASLLSGARGRPALSRRGLIELLVRLSWLLFDFPEIRELDLNPVNVYENHCTVLDWRASLAR
ncbi:MAG: acetate--CoA ligase family protein [Syntrophobacteraceae bacterium]|jgi:acetyltransferase|nr:acetate--CoA ligase family protein [Syntrophobacteraceae bacterium]